MRAFGYGAAAVLVLASAMPASARGRTPQPNQLASDLDGVGAEAPMSNRDLVATLADRLRTLYVEPEYGRQYADALRAYAAVGNYDGIFGQPLADLLGADLQAIHHDPRLRVRFAPESAAPTRPTPPAPVISAVEGARWIMPGIAYLRINRFAGTRESLAAIDRFMAGHTGARALVFDLRRNPGGDLADADRILPWLTAAPMRLAVVTVRADAAGPEAPVAIPDLTAMRLVGGAPGVTTREHWVTPLGDAHLRQAKVFLLVSRQTRSTAEYLAMALQASGRAIVVGERTSGIDHFGGSVRLANGLSVWIPVGRTSVAGKDWEGTGVAPDLAVPAEAALRAVLAREGADPARAARLATEAEAAL